jgi:acetyl esterase/lipase
LALLVCGLAAAQTPVAAKKESKTAAKAAGAIPENYNIPLWEEGKVPLAKGTGPLDKPFVTVFQPPEGKRNGASVVVAPGGGNIMLMYGAEGLEIAERYNEWGVTAFVLSYRLSPRYGADARQHDGKRAMQLVRFRASQFNLDPNKVGFIGFSAGSELARRMATIGPGDPKSEDPLDRQNPRPDYIGLVYSVGRSQPGESLKDFPPTFITAAQFDVGPSTSSAQFFVELTKARAIAELHLYQEGRHGYGTGFANDNFSDWMGRLEHFLKVRGLLPEGKH